MNRSPQAWTAYASSTTVILFTCRVPCQHKRPWFSVNEVRLLVGYETVLQSVLLGSPEIILTSFSECWHGVSCVDSSSQYQKQWQRRNAMSLQLNFYRAQCRSQCQENHLQDIVWKITVLSGNWVEHEKNNTSIDRKKNFTKLHMSVNSLLSAQSRKIVRWTPNQEPDCNCVSQSNDHKFSCTATRLRVYSLMSYNDLSRIIARHLSWKTSFWTHWNFSGNPKWNTLQIEAIFKTPWIRARFNFFIQIVRIS